MIESLGALLQEWNDRDAANRAVRVRYIDMARKNPSLRRVVAPRRDYYAIQSDLIKHERWYDDRRGLPIKQMRVVRGR